MRSSLIQSKNIKRIQENSYPGRGIIIGKTPNSNFYVQVYWIMGRSNNSRNRIFEKYDSCVRTKAFDENLNHFWNCLNEKNRISLLVKYTHIASNEVTIKIKNMNE